MNNYIPQNLYMQQPYNGYSQPMARPQIVPQMIPGKVVVGPEAIMPADIPMNGGVSLFPQQDWSCIWGKWWDSNGLIQTVKFVPEVVKETAPNLATNDILARLERIEQVLNGNGGGSAGNTIDGGDNHV